MDDLLYGCNRPVAITVRERARNGNREVAFSNG